MPARQATHAIPYTVRRSSRARRVRVNVHAQAELRSVGVEVVLPERAPERAAAAAVRELRPWIQRRVDEAQEVIGVLAARAGTVPYLGLPLLLVPQPGRTRVHRSGERLLVPAADPRPALERFYRRAARAEVGGRLDAATAIAGRPYRDLQIRPQPARWPSCAPEGPMSSNRPPPLP